VAPPKKAAPAKKGEVAQPHLDGVEILVVPEISDFTSEAGNKYVRERPLEFIAEELMTPAALDHEDDESESEDEPEEPSK